MDNKLQHFGMLCQQIASESALSVKEEIMASFFERYLASGTNNLLLLLQLLLPKYNHERVYYLKEKQIFSVLAVVLSDKLREGGGGGVSRVTEEDLKNDWNTTGCAGETALKFFRLAYLGEPLGAPPTARSRRWNDMTLEEFDGHLAALAATGDAAGRARVVADFFARACAPAVYLFFREVLGDLRINAGVRVVLSGLDGGGQRAYAIFQHAASLAAVAAQVLQIRRGDAEAAAAAEAAAPAPATTAPAARAARGASPAPSLVLGCPVAPMLAAPVRDIAVAINKNAGRGMFSEVKYDGERIQIHIANRPGGGGKTLHFFARSLKPMKADKYAGLEGDIVAALVNPADELILDGEILMVDRRTSIPLPFGTLGKHKKTGFADASVCIFLFDLLYRNGESLLRTPLHARRDALKASVRFLRNRVMFSELLLLEPSTPARDNSARNRILLQQHMNRAISEGLEGLVIKAVDSPYEPRARHWLKIKKDYLIQQLLLKQGPGGGGGVGGSVLGGSGGGAFIDTLDLVVVGGWYGSGGKKGLISVFLCAALDHLPGGDGGGEDDTDLSHYAGRFKTVCKVGNGLDDTALTILSDKYKRIMRPTSAGGVPAWLDCPSAVVPDMVLLDPFAGLRAPPQPHTDVMEIIGAELLVSKHHSAGISIRFPRVLKLRPDKSVLTATSLREVTEIYRSSKAALVPPGGALADVAAEDLSLKLTDNYVIEEPDERSNGGGGGAAADGAAQQRAEAPGMPDAKRRRLEAAAAVAGAAAGVPRASPPAPAPAPASAEAEAVVVGKYLRYIPSGGDAFDMRDELQLSAPGAPPPHYVLAHMTAAGLPWRRRGLMAAVEARCFGAEAAACVEAYDNFVRYSSAAPGDVHLTPARGTAAAATVASMVAQRTAAAAPGAPPPAVCPAEADDVCACLRRVLAYADARRAAGAGTVHVHLVKGPAGAVRGWPRVEQFLAQETAARAGAVRVTIFGAPEADTAAVVAPLSRERLDALAGPAAAAARGGDDDATLSLEATTETYRSDEEGP